MFRTVRAFNFLGSKVKTASRHKKPDLTKSTTGKIVLKKGHAAGKDAYARRPAIRSARSCDSRASWLSGKAQFFHGQESALQRMNDDT